MHEVYAYGVIAPSTLYELDDRFPAESGYAEIAAIHPSIGGEAAAGAYVLARLGVPTKLAGNRLGDDAESRRAVAMLTVAGVDCRAISMDERTGAVAEVVFASGSERTVFGTYRRMLQQSSWQEASAEDIAASRVVCLDPFFGSASQRAAAMCSEAGVPYITIDAPVESAVARHAEVLILSEEFANRAFGPADPATILSAYVERCRGLVILTRGGESLLYGRAGSRARSFDPFTVDVRDTTGAGDSFRAGVTYGMLAGSDDRGMIRVGSATAALVCMRSPGVVGSPTSKELAEFLASHA